MNIDNNLLVTFCLAGALMCSLASHAAGNGEDLSIIPRPAKSQQLTGQFLLNSNSKIVVESDAKDTIRVGEYMAKLLRTPTGYTLAVVPKSRAKSLKNTILLTTSKANAALGPEGYQLTVTEAGVVIRAPKPAGLFYGVQTLRQLLPTDIEKTDKTDGIAWSVPCANIEDSPRYSWRGLEIDACRHFMPVETLKRYIDLLAMHKMNVLHLHLTDDQGWRIQIKKYPKLTEIGAWRTEADGTRYGGFYTQEQIRDVVKYARERFVDIVPEIEMPGHSMAALATYPELSCTGGPFSVPNGWGIFRDVYCAGNDQTFEFVQDVLKEVAALFPGKYIHIGGDECPKDSWRKCPKCQERIKTESLKDEAELQSYFIRRAAKIVNSNGKKLIGWDEILEGGLAPNATVMSWRGTSGGIKAAQEGHDVVMCPTSHCYFDYDQAGTTPLQKVYFYEPTPGELTAEQAKHVLGAQGNLWSESIRDQDRLDYMAFPRACALAEVVWSPKSAHDWASFSNRMKNQYLRLGNLSVKYCPPAE